MSYQRWGWALQYVDGESEDYVYGGSYKKGKKEIEYIHDYGGISDSGFIEMLYHHWETDDKVFKEHFIKRLAERLKVKLRKKPLTVKQQLNFMLKATKKLEKEMNIKMEVK